MKSSESVKVPKHDRKFPSLHLAPEDCRSLKLKQSKQPEMVGSVKTPGDCIASDSVTPLSQRLSINQKSKEQVASKKTTSHSKDSKLARHAKFQK